MYQQLSEILSGTVVVLAMLLVALWRVSLDRISQLRRALDLASKAVDSSETATEKLAALATLHERRATEFFGIIESVEKERDGWQRFYRESSHAAGVAQAWLVRDMTRLIQIANGHAERLRAKGENAPPVDVDPRLREVVEDFSVAHASGKPEVTSLDAGAKAKAVDDPSLIPRLAE